jgi:hypothetical protein
MKNRSTKRALGSMFLAFEAIIIFFGTLVAFGLKFSDAGTVWTIGLALSLVAIALPGVLSRPGGYVAGWILQFALLVISIWSSTVNPVGVFYIFLAIILVSMWIWAMVAGGTVDAARVAWERANGTQTVQNGTEPEVFKIDTPNEK